MGTKARYHAGESKLAEQGPRTERRLWPQSRRCVQEGRNDSSGQQKPPHTVLEKAVSVCL